MAKLSYYIALPFIYLLSVLPFPVLYLVSDFFFFVLYYLIGYRKKVVNSNLRKSFPERTKAEIKEIEKKFYRYFCDLFLETFKTLTISSEKMLQHCSMSPAAERLFADFAAKDQSIMIVMGHYGNWEWAGNTFSLLCKHQLYVIYHPLSHPYFNNLIIKMRTRFGTKLIAMKDTFREMVANRSHLSATAFIADQTPAPDRAFWMKFLNQDTPVFPGTEKIGQKMNYPIVYVSIQKIKRGYYTLSADILKLPPFNATQEGDITIAHTQRLEADIVTQPDTWLWTHRRWKHQRPEHQSLLK